ncbi:hypothetical protein MARPO_0186s0001, partial [Marchantia polymorpha]
MRCMGGLWVVLLLWSSVLGSFSVQGYPQGYEYPTWSPTQVKEGNHPPGVGHHPPGVGGHGDDAGGHPPGVGGHPPGVGHHPPGVGHHSPIKDAVYALLSWKRAIYSDPLNITGSWVGDYPCYTDDDRKWVGVFCEVDPETDELVVAGIDLNHGMLAGTLVPELGYLKTVGIFHINSNYFHGSIPNTFRKLRKLTELDVSNNMLSGSFPRVVLRLPSLIYLDIRFNKFYGPLPDDLFDLPLDALFVNNNDFDGFLPSSLGRSPVSVMVVANNKLGGRVPTSIKNMSSTLNEILFLNNQFEGALPGEIGALNQVVVFDIAKNNLLSTLPNSIQNMESLEAFDIAENQFYGDLTAELCNLPNLANVTVVDNYFTGLSPACANLTARGVIFNFGGNCFGGVAGQKDNQTCAEFYQRLFPSPPAPVSLPLPLLL